MGGGIIREALSELNEAEDSRSTPREQATHRSAHLSRPHQSSSIYIFSRSRCITCTTDNTFPTRTGNKLSSAATITKTAIATPFQKMSIRHASKSVVDSLSLSRSSTYICRQCRRNAHPSQLATQQRQFTSTSERPEDLPFAERVRRKLWKGKPPGPENVDDLYGGPGVLETMYKERKERRARGRQTQSVPTSQPEDAPTDEPRVLKKVTPGRRTDENMDMGPDGNAHTLQKPTEIESGPPTRPDYIPATSWEGLPLVGSTGHWRENPAKAIDEYTPSVVLPHHMQ